MHISLNNERILIIQTPLFSGKIEFLSDVKIFEKSLNFKNGLLYLLCDECGVTDSSDNLQLFPLKKLKVNVFTKYYPCYMR